MNGHYRAVVVKTTIWLVAEIILSLTGLDSLADYSEFILGRESELTTIIAPSAAVSLQLL